MRAEPTYPTGKEQREVRDPKWALYYAFYRVLNGRESDGFELSPHAWACARVAVDEVIPKFYIRRTGKGTGRHIASQRRR